MVFRAAEWTTKYINDLPDSAFAFIALGGKKDSEGKTVRALDTAAMISFVMPSAKYSSAGSGLMLTKGSTAIRCLSRTTCPAVDSCGLTLGTFPLSQPLRPISLSSEEFIRNSLPTLERAQAMILDYWILRSYRLRKNLY